MSSVRGTCSPAIFVLGLLLLVVRVDGATRVFTDTNGRTLRGELVSVSGDQVTIKREDGQTFTVRAANFSQADIEFFKQNGLKEPAVPTPAPVPPAGASTAPMRLNVKIFSAKLEQQAKASAEKEQKISYKIEIKNTEPKRDLGKCRGVLMAFAKLLHYNDQTQVIIREEFDCEIQALDTFTYDTKAPVRIRYWSDATEGLRGSGYLFVLKDSSGKVVNVTGSSETAAKNHEAALELKLNSVFDRDYKFIKEGSTSFINN